MLQPCARRSTVLTLHPLVVLGIACAAFSSPCAGDVAEGAGRVGALELDLLKHALQRPPEGEGGSGGRGLDAGNGDARSQGEAAGRGHAPVQEPRPPSEVAKEVEEEAPRELDMEEAFWQWEQAVGCKAFRERHRELVEAYAPSKTPEQWPFNPSLQPLALAPCSAMRRSSVLVFVSAPGYLEGQLMDMKRVCPRCAVTCEFTLLRSAAWRADAHLFLRQTLPKRDQPWWQEGMPDDARSRVGNRTRPLIVYVNQERHPFRLFAKWCFAKSKEEEEQNRREASAMEQDSAQWQLHNSECPDLRTGIYKHDDHVQVTTAQYSLQFKAGQSLPRSSTKLGTPPIHRSVSNCGSPERERLAKEILDALPHHSFGRCLNSFGGARSHEFSLYPHCRHVLQRADYEMQETMRCVRSHYKFDLAFENSAEFPSYVTEKFFSNLDAGTVPVYYGAEDIANFAPPDSFVDVRKYNSTQDLIAFLKEVARDPVKYMQFHAWRYCNVWGRLTHAYALGWQDWPCRLCEKIASMERNP